MKQFCLGQLTKKLICKNNTRIFCSFRTVDFNRCSVFHADFRLNYALILGKYPFTVADSRGGFGGFSPPQSNKSSTYFSICFSRLVNVTIWLNFNRMVSICVMKVKENTN